MFNNKQAVILAIVSLLSGGIKLFEVPQEIEFLFLLGFTLPVIYALGAAQILAAVLILLLKTRLLGIHLFNLLLLVPGYFMVTSGHYVHLLIVISFLAYGFFVYRKSLAESLSGKNTT